MHDSAKAGQSGVSSAIPTPQAKAGEILVSGGCMKSDWFALFDKLKAAGGFGSDAQLAEHLGVTRAQISAWRNGKSDLGVITKLRIFDALGYEDLHGVLDRLLSDVDPVNGTEKHIKLLGRVGASTQRRRAKRT